MNVLLSITSNLISFIFQVFNSKQPPSSEPVLVLHLKENDGQLSREEGMLHDAVEVTQECSGENEEGPVKDKEDLINTEDEAITPTEDAQMEGRDDTKEKEELTETNNEHIQEIDIATTEKEQVTEEAKQKTDSRIDTDTTIETEDVIKV